jgi:hypothetical protein
MLKQTVDSHVFRHRDTGHHGPAQEDAAACALAVLEDPKRGFTTSDFLRTEVSPKARSLLQVSGGSRPGGNGTS